MKIGVAKRCTNTTLPVRLAGFGNPKRTFLGIHDDIWVRAMVIEQDGRRLAIVTGDALGFEHDRIASIAPVVYEKTGIPVGNILFNASHTHSAPQVQTTATPTIGAYLPEYADWWYEQVVQVIVEANDDLEEGTLSYGFTDCCGIGVNRRRMSKGYYEFAPYEEGLRNDETLIMKAECGGKLKAVVMKYSCHPTTVGTDYASGDYPGAARALVEARNPGTMAFFLQGCCGNIRVRTVKDNEFSGGDFTDVERFGTLLADAAAKVLAGPMTEVRGDISARKIYFELPIQPKKDKAFYEEGAGSANALDAWIAKWYVDNYDTMPDAKPYSMQRLDIGDALSIIGMEGEVCVEYEYHMAKLFEGRKVVTTGYSNGNPGYICTAAMYPEGGYEPEGSCVCYYNREGFEPKNEELILAQAEKLR